ncbi:hypothetical protein ON010_g13333 [Phytophthora cinnamomi]|nr:hypothetical protein ON010_g13333 [Phytophthora cinnamomi]
MFSRLLLLVSVVVTLLARTEAGNLRVESPLSTKSEAAATGKDSSEERKLNIRSNPNGPALVTFTPSK